MLYPRLIRKYLGSQLKKEKKRKKGEKREKKKTNSRPFITGNSYGEREMK